MTITRDDDVLGGEPRIKGTRIGVRHIAARVIDNSQSPAYVADQLDLALAEVYEALSYYYSHVDEIRDLRRENDAAFERVHNQSLKPKEPVQ
ncbi:DUF433 domain-containing protein [Haladaptatus sp. NG-WS-4]